LSAWFIMWLVTICSMILQQMQVS